MARQDALDLWVAVNSLRLQRDRFAIWVLRSPHPSGHVHYDCDWSPQLADAWQSWQSVFSLRSLPQVPHLPSAYIPQFLNENDLSNVALSEVDPAAPMTNQPASFSSRYMQHLGMNLWQWLFAGPVKSSLDRAQGIAIGQGLPLRLRLEIRDPELISLPWEIMQRQAGSRALSLKRKILFSRTSSDVDSLEARPLERSLRILLVLGKDSPNDAEERSTTSQLKLEHEAALLKKILEQNSHLNLRPTAKRRVDMLVQPGAAELSNALETGSYNVFFYSGHGMPGPDGGLLFLSDTTLSGTELSQVLLRAKVRLAVFNTCWGAKPEESRARSLPRSSLAEVLLHHGLPAVIAMRDSIADEEAVSFIQALAQALAERKAVDEAVAIARQHLLTLYHFNQPAWTLPVLYMHPDFDGELLLSEQTTQINQHTGFRPPVRQALLRDADNPKNTWPIYSDVMRIGRKPDINDLVISDPWVSSRHAEIFHRRQQVNDGLAMAYFLRDNSRYGTFYRQEGSWQEVHRREVALRPGTQIRFGSQSDGQVLEFVIES